MIRHTETAAKTTIKGARPFPAPLGHSSGVHGPRDVPGAPDCPVAALGELAWCCWAAMRVRRSWEQQQRPARGSSCGPLDGRVVRSLAPDGHPCTPGDPLRRVTPRGGSGGRGWCAVVGCPRRVAEPSQGACARAAGFCWRRQTRRLAPNVAVDCHSSTSTIAMGPDWPVRPAVPRTAVVLTVDRTLQRTVANIQPDREPIVFACGFNSSTN